MSIKTHIFSLGVCALALSGCATLDLKGERAEVKGAEQANAQVVAPPAFEPSDPDVHIYPTEGHYKNPLAPRHESTVLGNTTAGGYTVFDKSVTVYALPGQNVPAYLPNYAVPPYASTNTEYDGQKQIGIASAGNLPPVPNVEVAQPDGLGVASATGAVRKPLVLSVPQKPSMQPPVAAQPALTSPFAEVAATDADASVSATSAGRRSGPMLTGY